MKEISAPAGYKLSDEAFTITVKGADAGVDATDQTIAVFELIPSDEFTEQVKHGDLELVKEGAGDYSRLGNISFKVTSKTTGESHTIVTNANGYASTASSWNAHAFNTNAGTSKSGI